LDLSSLARFTRLLTSEQLACQSDANISQKKWKEFVIKP
jgi:hypothetical protein